MEEFNVGKRYCFFFPHGPSVERVKFPGETRLKIREWREGKFRSSDDGRAGGSGGPLQKIMTRKMTKSSTALRKALEWYRMSSSIRLIFDSYPDNGSSSTTIELVEMSRGATLSGRTRSSISAAPVDREQIVRYFVFGCGR